ncbi:MAG: flagellar hook-basal body complex protein FliE [Proteobacteria bacterium]|nr:flagellar hook-basal body complex protein FliE [Pseudomonadota bacterium]
MSVEGIGKIAKGLDALKGPQGANSSQIADFSKMVSNSLDSVMETQKTAETLSTEAMKDMSNVDMHELISAISEAELKLQTMVTIRDKTVAAYNKIMDMPL